MTYAGQPRILSSEADFFLLCSIAYLDFIATFAKDKLE